MFFLVLSLFSLLSVVIRQVCVSGIASRMIEEPQGGGGGGGGLFRGDMMKPNTRTVRGD